MGVDCSARRTTSTRDCVQGVARIFDAGLIVRVTLPDSCVPFVGNGNAISRTHAVHATSGLEAKARCQPRQCEKQSHDRVYLKKRFCKDKGGVFSWDSTHWVVLTSR